MVQCIRQAIGTSLFIDKQCTKQAIDTLQHLAESVHTPCCALYSNRCRRYAPLSHLTYGVRHVILLLAERGTHSLITLIGRDCIFCRCGTCNCCTHMTYHKAQQRYCHTEKPTDMS